ncbi:helix-turn-helix transcriptional regulator [Arcanobacterium buesumense]|uniref:WYL domain-containing protein n=1 Tax=Arcanobacterium buesumense TaxID=2722751 RepID=A0A6H2EL85_9ACTO|nr:WYL domain-containing protein [Arcanobacterium buesumense]QJC21771.1 WYL domain-containing protein [Arcanobacterium buesumense]
MGFGDLSLVRKRAIADYLLGKADVTLAELATRFDVSWQVMREEIAQLSTIELVSGAFFESPFDIWIDDDEPTPDSLVRVGNVESSGIPALSLPEVVALLAATDIAMLTVDQHDIHALSALRERIVAATAEHGYRSVLWPAPQLQAPREVLDILGQALADQRAVDIDYWKGGVDRPHRISATVFPVNVVYTPHPLLIAANAEGDVRRYRFDRITDARLGQRSVSRRLARKVHSHVIREHEVTGERVRLWCHPGAQWVAEEIPGANLQSSGNYDIIELPVRDKAWLFSLLVRLGKTVVRLEKV